MDKRDILGITIKKEENFSEWYIEILQKAQLISYTNVSGCYVLRPAAYSIWQFIQKYLDKFEGFSPEVAWITKYGDKKMEEPIAIRPTSEAIIYPHFSEWIQSYRDL